MVEIRVADPFDGRATKSAFARTGSRERSSKSSTRSSWTLDRVQLEPDLEADGCEQPPSGLEWYAFLSRYFPGRRRHDLEALKAYEPYRSAVAGNSFTVTGRVPIASIS
jgi:hypothetical protein